MQHSKLTDSFSLEDERFFGSYQAERVNAEECLTLEFDADKTQPSSTEQLAHFNRFRRPVAWVVAAMGSLSLVALGLHGLQQTARREVVAQIGSPTPLRASAATFASVSALPGGTVIASAGERTSEAPGSWTELIDSAVALVFEPTRPRTPDSKPPALADSTTSAMQASLVNDFTSELLSMCRAVPA